MGFVRRGIVKKGGLRHVVYKFNQLYDEKWVGVRKGFDAFEMGDTRARLWDDVLVPRALQAFISGRCKGGSLKGKGFAGANVLTISFARQVRRAAPKGLYKSGAAPSIPRTFAGRPEAGRYCMSLRRYFCEC